MAGGTVASTASTTLPSKPAVQVDPPKPGGTAPSLAATPRTTDELVQSAFAQHVRYAADKYRQTDVNEFGFEPAIPFLYPSGVKLQPYTVNGVSTPAVSSVSYKEFANFGDEWTRKPQSYEALFGMPCKVTEWTNYGQALVGGPVCQDLAITGQTNTMLKGPPKLDGIPKSVTLSNGESVDLYLREDSMDRIVSWQKYVGKSEQGNLYASYELRGSLKVFTDSDAFVALAKKALEEGDKPALSPGALDKKLPYTEADFDRIAREHRKVD